MEYTYVAVLMKPALPFFLQPILHEVIHLHVLSGQAFLLLHVLGGRIAVDKAFPIFADILLIRFGDPDALTVLPVQF